MKKMIQETAEVASSASAITHTPAEPAYEIVHDKVRIAGNAREWLVYVDGRLRAEFLGEQSAKDFVAIQKAKDADKAAAAIAPATHTPAPWNTDWVESMSGGYRRYEVVRLTHTIAWCPGTTPQDKANARLIAAAPDLLAALKHCLLEHGGFTIRGECERMARTAIAKAEGKEG